MKPNFAEVVKSFENRLKRKLTDFEYRILYLNFVKSSQNRK
ncbi:hypothetical protein [Halalkalibacter lacteus]|jgi:hypothetical protein